MSDRERDEPDIDDVPAGYARETINLTPTHRWKAAPGCNILVLDAGAVRLDYPSAWKVVPKSNRINIHDRPYPDDEGRFQITVFRLPKVAGKSWDDLPVDKLLRDAASEEPRKHRKNRKGGQRKLIHDVTTVARPDLQYAWIEHADLDPKNGRTIFTRQSIARARGVQPLITFDYYASRAEEYRPVWQHAMDSLRLGAPVNLLGDALN